MKTFKFTVQSVLNLKIKLEENEKMKLLKLQALLSGLYDELNLLKNRYKNVLLGLREKTMNGISPQAYADTTVYLKDLDKQIVSKMSEIEKMKESIEKQTKVVVEINKEIKMLEKLKEKQLAQYNHALQKEDELIIDDYISERISVSGKAV